MTRAAVALLLLASSLELGAQTTRSFDVVSVKRATGTAFGTPFVAVTGQRVSAPFVTLRMLVQVAYGVDRDQVVDGPPWIDTDHFEVNATTPAGTSVTAVREMLRALLTDRFGMVAHRESRDGAVHILTFSGQFGPKMRRSGDTCAPVMPPTGLPIPPPPPPPPAGAAEFIALGATPGGSRCGSLQMSGYISGRDMRIDSLRWIIAQELHRPVVDRTELEGGYDLDLMYLPDTGPPRMNGGAIPWDAPSLATALREQLGLRLESARGSVDVVVIDKVAAPTEN